MNDDVQNSQARRPIIQTVPITGFSAEITRLDYIAPLAVFVAFFSIVALISLTCLLWCCVESMDDVNIFRRVLLFYETILLFRIGYNFSPSIQISRGSGVKS